MDVDRRSTYKKSNNVIAFPSESRLMGVRRKLSTANRLQRQSVMQMPITARPDCQLLLLIHVRVHVASHAVGNCINLLHFITFAVVGALNELTNVAVT